MSFKRFAHSLRDAFNGVRYAFEHEQNFRLQLVVALIVLTLATILPLKVSEQLLIVVMVFMVLVMELLNTAIEKFIDLLKPRLHFYAKIIKDIMAAAVFITAFAALIIGIIIFIPYLVQAVIR